jgi:heme ABC exporter ATP-binding subunit CcmA
MAGASHNVCFPRSEVEATVHPSTDGPAVEASALTVVRGRIRVLDRLSLAIEHGESIAIMGPNGAGKSTLLKCVAGTVRPTSGTLRLFGEPAHSASKLRRQLGYVAHEIGLYRELTAFENLLFAARMHGLDAPRERVSASIATCDLKWAADRAVGKLSQGICQRLAIARVLVHTPKLLLLDEPFAGLDVKGRQWLVRLFETWRAEKRTVCFVSHDSALSSALADRIVWLNCGRIEGEEATRATVRTTVYGNVG